MARRIALDTGPLGMVTHPRANRVAAEWFRSMLQSDVEVVIPEIADYEVRRELVRAGKKKSLERLEQLTRILGYLPIDTATMRRAARLWAKARNLGKPSADPKELDGDAILAAQAQLVEAEVATDNVGHLSLFVETKRWRDIGFGHDELGRP